MSPFSDFFYELRRRKVPVSTQEWLALLRALSLGLHGSSLDGFYHLARAVLVKDLAHYDAFDAAFLASFHGVPAEALAITSELLDWLQNPKNREGLTDEQLRALQRLAPDELRRLFEERLAQQKKRHDGGNRWIGTGGSSPFGSGGTHPTGLRIGQGGGRSAMQVAEERRFRDYRNDHVLDVRRIDVALRMLRELGREGAAEELDLEATIDETAKNAGDLELVMRPPRRNRARLVLLMDVGGSMDPYAQLVEKLFTAASRAGRFARFRYFYFHNCVYESVYEDARFRRPVPVADLLAGSDRDEKLVIVGDAAMHPVELLERGGSIAFYTRNTTPGLDGGDRSGFARRGARGEWSEPTGLLWMRRLKEHFRRAVWLNPEPMQYWNQTTVKILGSLFHMFPLTLDGIDRAVKHLIRGSDQAPVPAVAGPGFPF